jgi:hypothetical protein
MRYAKAISVIAAIVLVFVIGVAAQNSQTQGQPNPGTPNGWYGCPMTSGYGYRMGPGMMGYGMMGPGMMGWANRPQQGTLNLSTSDVKASVERWIAMNGNPRLKVGAITEKDANTITADIVTAEKDVLVQRFSVDRHTGFWQAVQ